MLFINLQKMYIMRKTFYLPVLIFLISNSSFSQTSDQLSAKVEKFIEESSTITYREITSDTVNKILKHKVYFITLETKNMYNETGTDSDEFIVIDNGDKIKRFEWDNTNNDMPEFQSYIKEDFLLNDKSAPMFQGLLDLIYPVDEWDRDPIEFLQKDGKWYFLRDTYFSTKQGFEVTTDAAGKITAIRYKMKWETPDGF